MKNFYHVNKLVDFFTILIITATLIGCSTDSSPTGVSIDKFNGSIQGLRSVIGQAGDTVTVIEPELSTGTFSWSETDPNGNGDDNGIIIKAFNGWWVRPFNHSQAQPIELDWFNLPDNTNVTRIFRDMLATYAPDLYLKMPTVPKTIILDYTEVTATTSFNLYRGHPDVVIKHPNTPSDKNIMLHIKDYDTVVIESGITFEGQHDKYTPINSQNTGTSGLLQFETTTGEHPTSLTVYCNVKNAVQYGLAHKSSASGRAELVTIGGTYITGGVQINAGVKNLVLDNLVIEDPLGEGFGVNRNDSANPVSANIQYHQKVRQLSLTRLDSIKGKYTGVNTGWFINSTKNLGVNANEAFHIVMKDMGWLADGREIARPIGLQTKGGKFDGLYHSSDTYLRFVKLEMSGKTPAKSIQYPAILEASPDSEKNYYTNNMNLELVNMSAARTLMMNAYDTQEGNEGNIYSGEIKGNVISGDANGFLVRNSDNSFENFTFKRIDIVRSEKPPALRVNNTIIKDSILIEGGVINIETGIGHTINNLTVLGTAREIITFNNINTTARFGTSYDAIPEPEPIAVTIVGLNAPLGSVITAEDPSNVTITLDGIILTLPHILL